MRAAVRRCDLETATRLTLWLSRSLVDHGRPAEAILELQTAARSIRNKLGDSPQGARLLWPVLAALARRIDEHGDREHARTIAMQADREAIRCSSMAGRAALRALLLQLSSSPCLARPARAQRASGQYR